MLEQLVLMLSSSNGLARTAAAAALCDVAVVDAACAECIMKAAPGSGCHPVEACALPSKCSRCMRSQEVHLCLRGTRSSLMVALPAAKRILLLCLLDQEHSPAVSSKAGSACRRGQ